MVTNWSVRLDKHQTIESLIMVDFLRISKMLHFSKFFEIFEIHQYFPVKLLNALNFINLICLFLAIIVLRLLYTSGFNVRV